MKATRIILLAGALLATSGVAAAQPADGPRRGPAADVTRDQAVARADQRFQRLDTNRDGRVTQEEARALRQARMTQRQERRAERQGRMFDRLDTNRDGQISRDEFNQRREVRAERRGQRGMRGMRGRGGQHGARGAARLFGEDGVITAEEFRSRALQRFDRLDANRDGTITVAERRDVRQRMREERRARRQAPAQN